MADSESIIEYLRSSGAFLKGHFELSSGLHSADYVQCALALHCPVKAQEIGKELAGLWTGPRPDAVLSPALGGMIIGHETAKALGVKFMFCERLDGHMSLRRGFVLGPGMKVIIVEDVMTTGKSTLETAGIIRSCGGEVLAGLSIINRGSSDLGFEIKSLASIKLVAYQAQSCPMCAGGIPITKPGSRPPGK